jgi:predicted dehydrogenase
MHKGTTIRIGAIGVGRRLCGVLEGLRQAAQGKLEIVAVHDPSERSIQAAQELFGLTHEQVRTQEELLADPSIDWVFIGSYNRYHPEQIIAALQAGKHVFCEKPLATDLTKVPQLIQAWRGSGKQFALGLVLRYAPLYQTMHSLIQQGRIGKIISLEFNETLRPRHGAVIHGNWRRKREDAGTHLLEKCCHDLDLCLWLVNSDPVRVASFGGCNFFVPEYAHLEEELLDPQTGKSIFFRREDPRQISPFNSDKDIVDNQVAIIEFANQVRATFHTNCSAAITERRFYIIGSHGSIRADALTGVIEVDSIIPGSVRETIDTLHAGGHGGGDAYMAEQLAQTLLYGKPPAAGMREGLSSLLTACAIDQAMELGEVYSLERDWQCMKSLD